MRWLEIQKLECLENGTQLFQKMKKILNLCLKWHILRSYRFAMEVTFNYRLKMFDTFSFSQGFVKFVPFIHTERDKQLFGKSSSCIKPSDIVLVWFSYCKPGYDDWCSDSKAHWHSYIHNFMKKYQFSIPTSIF